jgi:TIR domain
MTVSSAKRFQVALSFPGEKRDYVLQVAELLAKQLGKEAVFYDDWYKHQLARPNLDTYLMNIYQNDSQLLVPFLCADYEHKQWCRLEWRAMRELLKQRQDDDIMPLRFDKTHISGLFSIDGYIDLESHGSKETAELILLRLKENSTLKSFTPPTEIPTSNFEADSTTRINLDNFPLENGALKFSKSEMILIETTDNNATEGCFWVIHRSRQLKIKARQHVIMISDEAEVKAEWEDAVRQLKSKKLIEEIKHRNSSDFAKKYKITSKGWEVSNRLKP